MYIKTIKIYGFGKHINREINFKTGLNVIYGDNEAGKSTMFAFIRAMFYGLTGRGEDNYRKRFMPWDRLDKMGKPVRFGGEMIFECDGIVYHEVCLWGTSKRDDACTLNEYYTGRAVKLLPNKTVGEQILKLTVDAYDSSMYIGQLASAIKQGGDKEGVLLARLSAVSGFDGEEKTGTAVKQLLKEKMDSLKAPRGKNGELDQLVIKKLNMQNELTRLSEVDNKVASKKGELEGLYKKRDALLSTAADYERLLKLSKAAKLLLTKDKVMTVFASVDNICTELEECRAVAEENEAGKNSPARWKILGGALCGVMGIVALLLGILLPGVLAAAGAGVKIALMSGGLAAIVLGAILIISCGSLLKKPASITRNGVKVDVLQRIEELEETLTQKEILIQSYLDGEPIEKMNVKWREAEQLIKNASDEERRYATSKPIAGFEEALGTVRKQLEPILEKIGYIQSGIDSLRASSNVSFSEASDALSGIDAEIEKKNNEYKAYELAASVLDESMEEIRTTLCPRLCSETERIFESITGRHIHVKIAEDFTISVYDNSVPHSINSYSGATVDQAYFALRVAIAKIISPKDERYSMMLDDSFVQYDDGRMSNGLDFLAEYANSEENAGQIIFATCRKQLSDLASKTKVDVISL